MIEGIYNNNVFYGETKEEIVKEVSETYGVILDESCIKFNQEIDESEVL